MRVFKKNLSKNERAILSLSQPEGWCGACMKWMPQIHFIRNEK
jgi:hypothetical protein